MSPAPSPSPTHHNHHTHHYHSRASTAPLRGQHMPPPPASGQNNALTPNPKSRPLSGSMSNLSLANSRKWNSTSDFRDQSPGPNSPMARYGLMSTKGWYTQISIRVSDDSKPDPCRACDHLLVRNKTWQTELCSDMGEFDLKLFFLEMRTGLRGMISHLLHFIQKWWIKLRGVEVNAHRWRQVDLDDDHVLPNWNLSHWLEAHFFSSFSLMTVRP